MMDAITHAIGQWMLVNTALFAGLLALAMVCNAVQRRQHRRQRDADLARAIREAEGRGRALIAFERQQAGDQ